MRIEFPCPKSPASMKTSNGGFHCNFCNREVTDLTHKSAEEIDNWSKVNKNACVIIHETEQSGNADLLKRFAFAALLVFGTGLFSISNAQIANGIDSFKYAVETQDSTSIALLNVSLTNRYGRKLGGSVWAVLPNGKEVELLEDEMGTYFLEVPTYCKNKDIVIFALVGDIKKKRVIQVYSLSEPVDINIQFRTKRYAYRHIMVGSF